MAKALIVYATRKNATKSIAELIGEGLRFGGVEATVMNMADVEKAKVDLESFDAIVLGAPTYHGEMHSGMKTFLHSCGSIRALMPDLVEAGYDVINPVQTNCRGMDAEGLKADFGTDICFWGGGCDTRDVLPHGTPEDVKDHVKRRLDVFMPGGGFVFNTIHNILPEAPARNIVAMYEAIEEYGG
jgi:uroporphyrinogen-III decarboxylase